MKNNILCGDSLEVLKDFEDNYFDSVITDPPYGLSFMGKKWDYDVPQVELWKEVYRVLKPGGHILSFAGSRTYHRMAVNIEDAGFEIRDMLGWLYGSGFPKSHNIGKAVDKLQGNEREHLGKKIKKAGDITGGNFKKGGNYKDKEINITKGNSQWEGWGTALKPAHEPIVMARKPFNTSVAENVLTHGTGGINIDECRVGTDGGTKRSHQSEYPKKENGKEDRSKHWARTGHKINELNQGRFPANIIHDGSEEVLEIFPDSKAGKFKGKGSQSGGIWNKSTGLPAGVEYGDKGSAARFFYCAKASKAERGNKNNHPTVKPIKLMEYLVRLVTPKEGIVLEPFAGSGTTLIACKQQGFNYIGIEREQEYCDIAEARLKGVKIQGELF